MRGGYLHNEIMANELDRAFVRAGFETHREMHVTWPNGSGFIDLVATLGTIRIAIELECSVRRVPRDLLKAAAVPATELWVVVPDRRLARSVQRVLEHLGISSRMTGIFVLTFGQALQRVTNCFSCIASSNGPGNQIA